VIRYEVAYSTVIDTAMPSRSVKHGVSVRFGHQIGCIIFETRNSIGDLAQYERDIEDHTCFVQGVSAAWLSAREVTNGHARGTCRTRGRSRLCSHILPRADLCVCCHDISFAARLNNQGCAARLPSSPGAARMLVSPVCRRCGTKPEAPQGCA
jgi:hypothetical protein